MFSTIINVKAVIFDMDGVITNTMPDHFRAWHKILLEEGIHATHHDIYSREGQKGTQSVKEIFTQYKKPFDLKKANKLLKRKEELFKKRVKTRFIVGARTFLKRLKNKGIRLALVTGTSRHEMHRILPVALFNSFEVVVTGSDVKHGKPHPEPYLSALKKLKIKASESIVIENAPFGIRSAKAAKIKCIALETSLSREYLKEADKISLSIKELQAHVSFEPGI